MSKKKIKILHLVLGLGMGGAEVLLTHYVAALGNDKYEHYLYFFGNDGPIRKRLDIQNLAIQKGKELVSIKRPIEFIYRLFVLIHDLRKFILKNRIQVIQSHLGHANRLGVTIGKITNVPAFPTVHNTMAFVDRRTKWDFRVHLLNAVDSTIYRIADKVIAVSNEIKGVIKTKFKLPDEKVTVLKNGIIFNGTINYDKSDIKYRTEINKSIKIIAVGSLTFQKYFEVLIKAANILMKNGVSHFCISIAGEGKERKYLENLIVELGVKKNVILLGNREDVLDLMKQSDIFVIPSRYEGLSIAMIEAMACGLPVIASDAPGLARYIKHGINGLLFDVGDHQSLAECINGLINDVIMRERLSFGAREYFNREFDMRKNIDALKCLINEHYTN